MLNFELLRAFVAVAECGGFHRAAERLNLTQSTISQASVRRLANTTSSSPARSCSGPFDGGDDALGEAAGEGDCEISGAGRDRPADGEGGPPSHHKIIPPAEIEERQRPAHDKNDNGGDHDRKDESCFAFHASLGSFVLKYWATIKIASPALPLVSFRRRSCRPRGR